MNCPLCDKSVDKDNPSTWKEVKGWVGGPRKDSMRLREDTGRYAHDECVAKLQAGQAIDQPSLLDIQKKETDPQVFGFLQPSDLPEELQ